MSYKVQSISVFEKQAKRLSKKYTSLKAELLALIEELKENPSKGVALGNACFKIRMAIASKGKGKSAGARIITTFVVSEATVYLITIYDKSEKATITDVELAELIKDIPSPL